MEQNRFARLCRSWALALLVAEGTHLVLTAQRSGPAGTHALGLDDAVRLALALNPELRASGARVVAAAGRAYQAQKWPNPELELGTEDGPASGGHVISGAKQTVGAAQTLPFPGKKKLDREIGMAGVRVAEAELSLRRRELVRDVKTAYFSVLAAERFVETAGELVKVAESSSATARKRVEAGAAADQEQLRAEIPLEQARTELAGFQREVVTARQTLATLIGKSDLSETPVSGVLAETADLTLLDEGPERWLPTHPSVVAARTSRERAELELRRARLEPYPDVKFGVAGGREGGLDRSSILEFRVSMPFPIIDRSKGRKQEASANVDIAEAETSAIEQRLLRAWRTASQRLRTAVEQTANYRERILPKANEALRLVQIGFEHGKFGFIDLLDVQRTTAEARLAYQQKLLELNVAQAEIEALSPGRSRAPQQAEATH
ncbi:MAG: TolC family protein [Verrucomicrobia bacterium]|nr:TolC family protein [Verrucomicrobiota bacterium]